MRAFSIVLVAPFLLLNAPAARAEPQPTKPKVDRKAPDYVRCVTVTETGSLVQRRKTCKTNAEWSRIEAAQQREADDLVNRSRGAITTSGT